MSLVFPACSSDFIIPVPVWRPLQQWRKRLRIVCRVLLWKFRTQPALPMGNSIPNLLPVVLPPWGKKRPMLPGIICPSNRFRFYPYHHFTNCQLPCPMAKWTILKNTTEEWLLLWTWLPVIKILSKNSHRYIYLTFETFHFFNNYIPILVNSRMELIFKMKFEKFWNSFYKVTIVKFLLKLINPRWIIEMKNWKIKITKKPNTMSLNCSYFYLNGTFSIRRRQKSMKLIKNFLWVLN